MSPRHRAGSRAGELRPVWTAAGDRRTYGAAHRTRIVTLWRNGDFLRFWFGESVSLAGTQVTQLALPLTAVGLFGAGAEQVGLLRMLQLVPFLVLALPFGMWADRRRRRPIMIWANVARAIGIGLIPLLAMLHQLRMPAVYVIALAAGVATVLFDVCFMSYIPTLVKDKSLLVEANGKLGTTMATAEVVGPGAAGVLIQLVSAPIALLVDAVSYAVSVVSLRSIRTLEEAPEAPEAPQVEQRRLGAELFEGLRLVLSNPYLRSVTLSGTMFNFAHTFVEAVFLVYAVNELRFGAGVIGVILSVGSVGAVLGMAFAQQLIRRFRIGRVYTVAMILSLGASVLIPAATGPRFAVIGMFMTGLFLSYAGSGVSNVIVISLRQVLTPNQVMGRMTAAVRMLLYGAAAFGGPVGGLLAGWLGLRSSLWVAALFAAASLVPVFASRLPRMTALPEPSADDRMAKAAAREAAVATSH